MGSAPLPLQPATAPLHARPPQQHHSQSTVTTPPLKGHEMSCPADPFEAIDVDVLRTRDGLIPRLEESASALRPRHPWEQVQQQASSQCHRTSSASGEVDG